MTPNRPGHADYRKPVADAAGFELGRTLTGYACPEHGNLHNPTPRYTYTLWLDGRLVDSSPRAGALTAAARQPGAADAYAEAGR